MMMSKLLCSNRLVGTTIPSFYYIRFVDVTNTIGTSTDNTKYNCYQRLIKKSSRNYSQHNNNINTQSSLFNIKQKNSLPIQSIRIISRPPVIVRSTLLRSLTTTGNDSSSMTSQSSNTTIVQVNVHSKCPYGVFYLPKNSTKDIVKRAYYQAASIYHPDRLDTGNADIFLRIRQAFEEIYFNNNDDDTVTNKDGSTSSRRRSNYNDVFTSSTTTGSTDLLYTTEQERISSVLNFNIDEQARQEVIREYNAMIAQGGKPSKGGIWEMARLIVESDIRDKERRQQQQYGGTTTISNQIPSGTKPTTETTTTPISLSHRRRRRK